MRNVLIAQTAVATSLGADPQTVFQSLLNNESGIRKIDRFTTKNYKSDYAALIKDIEAPESRSLFLNLADLILNQLTGIPGDCAVLTATTKACIDLLGKNNPECKNGANAELFAYNPECKNGANAELFAYDSECKNGANAELFAYDYLILSSISKYIAGKLNLKNTGINISSACASSTVAIIKGAQMIINKRADSVLIFCADIISEFVFSGFSALNALSVNPAQPFDITRKGLSLGDGGAAILLMGDDIAKKNHITCDTSVKGFGIASDASHITAPAHDGRGLIIAINKALKKADLNCDRIGAISTHGTGTIYNDLMEIKALKHIFSNLQIPGNSIKGSIGHTLGGAGGIEAVMGSLMLREHILPGTHGFSVPEKGAENLISSENVSFSKDYLLSINSGFGGINAALILKREK
ncbi:MAG: beta-ketoacyl-[acyl-carrier-protein] synthase family protein [Desulfobacterales bacterium]|nr:beta-ketoacyl-[acyl-carrier-protein] synthase family protein [Desulfobacterales bacterium]